MRPKRLACTAIFLVYVAATARPEPALSIEAAVAAAIKNNASLARTAISVAADKRQADAAKNLLYPGVSVGAGIARSGSGTTEADRYSAYGSVSLSLSLSASMRTKMARLGLVYDSSALSYSAAVRSLELEVRKAFYAVLLDKANLELARQNLEREKKSYDQVKVKYSAGLLPELDLLSAQVSLAEMGPKVDSAQVSLDDDLDTLRLLLGLEPGTAFDLEGSLDSAKTITAAVLQGAIDAASGTENLSIAEIRTSIEIAKVDRQLAAASVASPSLSLSAKVAPALGYSSTKSSLAVADTGSISVGLSLPLDGYLPDSSAKIALAEADDSLVSLDNKLSEALRDSRSSRATLLRGIKAAVSSLSVLAGNVDLAQKKYDLTNAAYAKGVKDISDVETAAGSLDSAKANVIAEEYTLVSKVLELESELGVAFATIGR